MKNKDNSKLADFSKILFATAYVAMVSPTTSALAASGFSTTKTELANPPSQLLIANDSENPSDILPEEVKNSVVQDISEREGVEASALQVVKAEKETWSDGCLGLKTSGLCTMATITGWRVTVTDAQQTWVYRTDESGSMAKLDEESTKIASTTMVRRQITTQRVSTQIQKRQTVRDLHRMIDPMMRER
ncbi:hypothetical protein [Calothrix sp. 336/3]|uniref:hypothetical protein n=1 Tax=Calothrix sp. 336/3 TaxID=1337936 RepID=UPI00069B6CB5|nr:hypothetical protein [Calothrix sp. 336/3]